MDLKFSSNHTLIPILSSSTFSKSSAILSIDNFLPLVLEHHLPSDVIYNFIVSLIDIIKLPHSYITSASFLTSTAILRFTNISDHDICFSSLLKIPLYCNFKHIFIRHYLPDSTRLLGKVLYHSMILYIMPLNKTNANFV